MLVLVQGGLAKVLAEGTNTKGYSSTSLAMGFANVPAGTAEGVSGACLCERTLADCRGRALSQHARPLPLS